MTHIDSYSVSELKALALNLRHCAAEKMMRAGLEPDDPRRENCTEWKAADALDMLSTATLDGK